MTDLQNESDWNGSKWSLGCQYFFLIFQKNRLRFEWITAILWTYSDRNDKTAERAWPEWLKIILGVSKTGAYHIGLGSQHLRVLGYKFLIFRLLTVTGMTKMQDESDWNGPKCSLEVNIKGYEDKTKLTRMIKKIILEGSKTGAYHFGLSSQHSEVLTHTYLIFSLPTVTGMT